MDQGSGRKGMRFASDVKQTRSNVFVVFMLL
jgi:hypothetical protein